MEAVPKTELMTDTGTGARTMSLLIASEIRGSKDAAKADENMNALFQHIDSDSSGTITREEFGTLYRKMAEAIKADAEKEAMHIATEARQKEKIKNVRRVVIVLGHFVLLLAAINTGLTTVIVRGLVQGRLCPG
jgi:lauroyl/myristoyl acyltransferase